MSEDSPDKSVSLINLGSLTKPIDTLTKGLVDGAGAFLSRISLPAAEEFGLALRDKVSSWRTLNAAKIALKAERIMNEQGDVEQKHAHPRLVWATLENGSWTADEELQDMWAGLLASSCTEGGNDESNLIFVNLLSQLTTSEAKLLTYLCQQAQKVTNPIGVVGAYTVEISKERLMDVTGVNDRHQINRELAHLNALELIHGQFGSEPETEETEAYSHLDLLNQWVHTPDFDVANIYPTHLGISLYVRCEGSLLPPAEYFQLSSERG